MMYINPFVAGILVTIMVELIIVITGSVILNVQRNRK